MNELFSCSDDKNVWKWDKSTEPVAKVGSVDTYITGMFLFLRPLLFLIVRIFCVVLFCYDICGCVCWCSSVYPDMHWFPSKRQAGGASSDIFVMACTDGIISSPPAYFSLRSTTISQLPQSLKDFSLSYILIC